MVCTDIHIGLVNNMECKKEGLQTLSGIKNTYGIDRIAQEPGNHILYYLQGGSDTAFVREESMHIPEDTQVGK